MSIQIELPVKVTCDHCGIYAMHAIELTVSASGKKLRVTDREDDLVPYDWERIIRPYVYTVVIYCLECSKSHRQRGHPP